MAKTKITSVMASISITGILILVALTAIPLINHVFAKQTLTLNKNPSHENNNNKNGDVSQESINIENKALKSSNTKNFAKTILKIHNRERAAVGSPALVWSNTLAANAKSWASHLAQIGTLQHSTGKGYGKNLSFRSDSRGPGAISTTSLLQGWVNEKNGYSVHAFQWPGDKAHAHYTQLVWKTTTKIGCGTAVSGNSVYLTCQYTPQGNIQGERPY